MPHHGYVYTVDAADSVQEALAIRKGRIVDLGATPALDALLVRLTGRT